MKLLMTHLPEFSADILLFKKQELFVKKIQRKAKGKFFGLCNTREALKLFKAAPPPLKSPANIAPFYISKAKPQNLQKELNSNQWN